LFFPSKQGSIDCGIAVCQPGLFFSNEEMVSVLQIGDEIGVVLRGKDACAGGVEWRERQILDFGLTARCA
jgi:hypothetical protein